MDIFEQIKSQVIDEITKRIKTLLSLDLSFVPIDSEGTYSFSLNEKMVNDALMKKELPQEIDTLWIVFKNAIAIHSDVDAKGMKIGLDLAFHVESLSYQAGLLEGKLMMVEPVKVTPKNTAASLAKGMIESKIRQEIQARSKDYGISINGESYTINRQLSFNELVTIPYLGERNLQDLFQIASIKYEGKALRGQLKLINIM